MKRALRFKAAKILAWMLLWPSVGWSYYLTDVLEMDVVVHFVDVGIGDAIFIELPDRQHEIIIDGGDIRRGYNFFDYLEGSVDPPVELAVITHPDYDHWSGIERLCNTYTVNELWDPGYNRDCKFTGAHAEDNRQRDTYLKFIKSISQSQTRVNRPCPWDPHIPAYELDGVYLWVLYSQADPEGPTCEYIINNASMVLKLRYRNIRFLFTGDGNGLDRKESDTSDPKYVEAKLLELEKSTPGILRAEVLKVPHHGSPTASAVQFIRSVAPRYAVISSASTSHYHLPPSRMVRRYQTIRFENGRKIKKVLRTNYREKDFDHRKFGDDHVICGTNGESDDVICDYIWNFE